MNRHFTLFLLATLLLATTPVLGQGGLRYTILVTEFENQAGWVAQWNFGNAWDTVMTDQLNKSGRFIVLGEADMRGDALAEQDLAASGRTAQGSKTPVTGQLTPAQILLKGAVTHVQGSTSGGGGGVRVKGFRVGGKGGKAEMNVTVYMVDSTTGQVIASTSVVGKSKSKGVSVGYYNSGLGADAQAYENDNAGRAMEDAIAQSVEWLVEQLDEVPWTGTVATVRGDQVYINRGEREGVTVGQRFVVGTSDVIRDPDTGEVLDVFVNEIAQLEASSVREKLTICKVIAGDAAKLEAGMLVGLP